MKTNLDQLSIPSFCWIRPSSFLHVNLRQSKSILCYFCGKYHGFSGRKCALCGLDRKCFESNCSYILFSSWRVAISYKNAGKYGKFGFLWRNFLKKVFRDTQRSNRMKTCLPRSMQPRDYFISLIFSKDKLGKFQCRMLLKADKFYWLINFFKNRSDFFT